MVRAGTCDCLLYVLKGGACGAAAGHAAACGPPAPPGFALRAGGPAGQGRPKASTLSGIEASRVPASACANPRCPRTAERLCRALVC